ncbi:MAG: reactive intermediate/imine deaminase [Candidatus Marinimicrobia bacterium]|nr:reactive intermediate/imine deaminase [Candidatus Neomarinimicrobiota bacterium]
MRKEISTTHAPAAIGPYSQAVEKAGMLFCSGQLPMVPETGQLIVDDIQKATRQALNNLIAIVEAAGYSRADIVKVNVYVKNMADFAAINEIYAQFFTDTKPARALVEVAEIPKSAPIEIECVAVK